MNLKLETKDVRTMFTFSHITKVTARDCIVTEDCAYFLIDPDKIGLAIGRNGETIREVRNVLQKQVKLFSYADKPEDLIKNIIPNIKNIRVDNDSIFVSINKKDKSYAIGKNGSNIKVAREFLKRHFEMKNLKLRV